MAKDDPKPKAPAKAPGKLKAVLSTKPVKYGLIAVVLGVGGMGASQFLPKHVDHPVSGTHEAAAHDPAAKPEPFWATNKYIKILTDAAHSFETKLNDLRRVDEHNKDLRNENAHLKLAIEKLKMECSSTVAAVKSGRFGTELDAETGAQIGRVLETIDFRAPVQLLPAQMHTLGISYFKAKDWERSAVIFNHLVTEDKTKEFRTPRNYLLAAVSWYHLDHFHLSDVFLGKVLEFPEDPKNLKSFAQARLWKALVAKRTNRKDVAQKWLRDLVDHHPQSPETAKVNAGSKEERREPGSQSDPGTAPAHH